MILGLRIGYSFWGFLGDHKLDLHGNEVSAPDGNATYSWSILYEAQRRGHTVFAMQKDRDMPAWERLGADNFAAFSQGRRIVAYTGTRATGGVELPELDVLLLEWRWPIKGRNSGIDRSHPDYQPDLDRQLQLLRHYSGKIPIIIWDLDHKLETTDEAAWHPDAIFETSVHPALNLIERTQIQAPFCMDAILEHNTRMVDPRRKLVYVGNRYERDDVIDEYVRPVSDAFPGGVEFWGGWTREPNLSECKARWPNVSYHGRITTREFRDAYATAAGVPLLAKRSYLRTGFVTPRIWEALLFGSIPIGLEEMTGIHQYLPSRLIARSGNDLAFIAHELSRMNLEERDALRRLVADLIGFMDVRGFLDRIEDVVDKKAVRRR